jgi:hypothetical protein
VQLGPYIVFMHQDSLFEVKVWLGAHDSRQANDVSRLDFGDLWTHSYNLGNSAGITVGKDDARLVGTGFHEDCPALTAERLDHFALVRDETFTDLPYPSLRALALILAANFGPWCIAASPIAALA